MSNNIMDFPDLGGQLTHKVIKCCIDVHKHFGPGLLESVYEAALAIEFQNNKINFEKQKAVEVFYKGSNLGVGYRLDFLVEDKLILEIKSSDSLLPVHQAQILSYMRISEKPLGLLINFNNKLLKDGMKRFALEEFNT